MSHAFTAPPLDASHYLCWSESDGRTRADALLVSCYSRQQAAEDYVAILDALNNARMWHVAPAPETTARICEGGQPAMVVVETQGGEITRWRVSGRMIPEYQSKRMKP